MTLGDEDRAFKSFVIFNCILVWVVLVSLKCCEAEASETVVSPADMTVGVLRSMKNRPWVVCGKVLSDEERISEAWSISKALYREYKSEERRYSIWGILAIMRHESAFDSCALGIRPRKWGYAKKMLKPSKKGVSHSLNEVTSFISNKAATRAFKTGFDLGLCQPLSGWYYRGEEEKALTVEGGVAFCLRAADMKGGKEPWLFWKGTKPSVRYKKRIDKIMSIMKGHKK